MARGSPCLGSLGGSSSCGCEIERLIRSILRIHTELSTAKELKPCPEINGLFEELVGICTQSRNARSTRMVLLLIGEVDAGAN